MGFPHPRMLCPNDPFAIKLRVPGALLCGPLSDSRIALERSLEELLAKDMEIPTKAGFAQDEKDAALKEARRRHALRNSLTRYGGKVSFRVGQARRSR